MKHHGWLPYNCHDYHQHGRYHHKYYDLPREHHVHDGVRGHFFRKLNDVAVDFVAGHPHGGHLMIMRRGGRHHLDLSAMFNGVHNKSLHHRARKMHHHYHGHLHDHGHHHKHGNRFWHPNIKGHHGSRRLHRCHGHEYYELHRQSDPCHGGRRSKSVLLVTGNRPAGDVDHAIRKGTIDEKEVAAVEVVQQQPDDHDSMELANIPINMLRIE